jgi:adenine-specific DNA methylase
MSDKDHPRLIEVAFPLKQASLDSVHEKNVRHGHISTLHIWPARRPLAACRAALIATLLPDPGTPQKRKELLEKIGGKVVTEVQKKKVGGKTVEVVKERTEGGVLHWGNENSPDMDWFREEIRKAYGGRAPRVLDPFAGGGAIPLEAMRLGCEATAIDINPVAWFILKCTLEYPQKLAGQVRPLPNFAVESGEFMEAYLKGTGKLTKKQAEKELAQYQRGLFPPPEADLASHVRAWGWWVLQQARKDLERFYPTIDGKPTVAYLWARTVTCKNCRATIPLLKTRWLCKRDKRRVLLTMEPNHDRSGVVFGVQQDVPVVGGNTAQRKANDKQVGQGTMSRSGTTCPCCGMMLTWDDLRLEGKSGKFGSALNAVVVDGPSGKEYRRPLEHEIALVKEAGRFAGTVFDTIPFGVPDEQTPGPAGSRLNSSSLRFYGLNTWKDLFSPRQLLSLGVFVQAIREMKDHLRAEGYGPDWLEAIEAYLGCMLDRLANQSSNLSHWNLGGEKIEGTFARFAFPIVWDFVEVNPLGQTSGGFTSAFDWVTLVVDHFTEAAKLKPAPSALRCSAISAEVEKVDIVLTDPPYYDAIAYTDLMDFFYVWLRRALHCASPEFNEAFSNALAPKWDTNKSDGELIDNPTQFDGDKLRSKHTYEDGMYRSFLSCHRSLTTDGRLVIVFAHKHPDAWETLVSAIIRAGFVVDGSWPIQTERLARTRSLASSALSSSVWLVCKKRPEAARPGWDNRVLDEMRHNIHTRLRDYWDAGIQGPDFVWAATGPALEAYSKHPIVKKANEPGKLLEVAEFLRAVRRLVVDFVVGRVLSGDGDENTASGLDDITTYYIMHRHDFGMEDAPIGACILYAVSCNLSDNDLASRHEILLRTGGLSADDADETDGDDEEGSDTDTEPEEGTGSTVKLRPWHQRKRKTMGYDAEGRPAPLIDQVHRLMHLWKAGDVVKVDDYLDARGLRKHALFLQLLQALIELSGKGPEEKVLFKSDERVILENISNHIAALGVAPARSASLFKDVDAEDAE